MRTAPVVLISETVSFAATDGAGTFKAPTYGLRNVDTVPVSIEQIAFNTGTIVAVSNAAAMSVNLRYRNQPITNGWIPIQSFCAVRNDSWSRVPVVRLPVPIVLQPGEWIDVSFSNALCGSRAISFVGAVATGRFTDDFRPPPRLPYFAAYVGDVQDGSSNLPFSFASTPQDLGNPFPGEFRLKQIIGAVATSVATVSAPSLLAVVLPSAIWPEFKARISDHLGQYWVTAPTPIPALANMVTRAWPLDYPFPRNGFLRVEIEGTATWDTVNLPTYARPIVGLVGYRDLLVPPSPPGRLALK